MSSPVEASHPPLEGSALAVLQHFRLIVAAMQGHYRSMYKQTGLSGAQLWFLREVAAEPGLTLGQVAQRQAIHQSTASNQLEKLVRRGLVQRIKGEEDRRLTRLQLTAAGLATLEETPGPPRGVLQELLVSMPHAELQQLDTALAGLVERLAPWLDQNDTAVKTPLAAMLEQGDQPD
ncbi:MarR family winged helix-turn-helix transcriptional regulator [Chitiniphilus eburneus]|uniref:MarR family winged helix-turn-helix transcriptional regulator n=1 Tax=Chitiniphilus eburneus TaxID=2571148 RepID=UPI00145F3A66|nr:MarR family winged helix-turn-helix transcriptional regulator [Chitiniphilus eburneus]